MSKLQNAVNGLVDRFTNPEFDPLSLNPYIALDFLLTGNNSRALKTGGTQAAYLDLVPTWENPGTASDATQGTSGSQFVCLAHETGANYLHLPGVAGNYASVPHNANLVGWGDFALEFRGSPSDLTGFECLLSKFTGGLSFAWYLSNATMAININGADYNATAALTTIVGLLGLRVIRSGASLSYAADYGSGYVSVGSTVTVSTTATGASTGPFEIGSYDLGTAAPLRGRSFRARAWNTATPDISAPVLDINFAAVPHNSTSFVCTSGQTVTVNQSGNNPVTIIGKPVARFDGVDDFLSGTFASAITGGRMFIIYRHLGGTAYSRAFSTDVGVTDHNNTQSLAWRLGFGGAGNLADASYYNGGLYNTQGGPTSGLHEILADGASGLSSRINNGVAASSAVDLSGLASTRFITAMGDNLHRAMDLEALYLLPADTSAANVAKMRKWLNDTHNLGLTLP